MRRALGRLREQIRGGGKIAALEQDPAHIRSGGRRSDRRRTKTVAGGCSRVHLVVRRSMAYLSNMRPEELLIPTPQGLFCPPGGFHIDPLRPVARALITHGHSDHARAGHGSVLATRETLDIMRIRCGENFAGTTQLLRLGETRRSGGVDVTFHPAGHILGSAQICVERNGLRIVASGDYKDVPDPTCLPFEPIALRRLHHRGDVRAAGVSPWRRAKSRSTKLLARSRCFPNARISSAPMRSAKRNA